MSKIVRIHAVLEPRPYWVLPGEDPKAAVDLLLSGQEIELWSGCKTKSFVATVDEEWHHTVGERFRGYDVRRDRMTVWRCTSYDSRCGFWLQAEDDPKHRINVSERAIGRTFHRIYED